MSVGIALWNTTSRWISRPARSWCSGWPTPIVFSGFEIGIAVPYPAVSIEQDYGYVAHHPLAEAYRLYEPPPHNRPTWDLTSVLYAVFPERGYFDVSAAGTVTVEDDAFSRFDAAAEGQHRFLQLNDVQIARVTEALVQLSSQPPGTSFERGEPQIRCSTRRLWRAWRRTFGRRYLRHPVKP